MHLLHLLVLQYSIFKDQSLTEQGGVSDNVDGQASLAGQNVEGATPALAHRTQLTLVAALT